MNLVIMVRYLFIIMILGGYYRSFQHTLICLHAPDPVCMLLSNLDEVTCHYTCRACAADFVSLMTTPCVP
jgi:hypothetical protein